MKMDKEVRRKRVITAAISFVCGLFSASCSDTPMGMPDTMLRPVADVTSDTAGALLVEQRRTIIYQQLLLSHEAADDFLVPPGSRWALSHVLLYGGEAPTTSAVVELAIYADAGGSPGTAILRTNVNPVTDVEFTPGAFCCAVLLALPASVQLMPGTYWLGLRPVSGFGTFWTWILSPDNNLWEARYADHNVTPIEWKEISGSGESNLAFAAYGKVGTPSSITTDLVTTLAGLGLAAGTETSFQAKLRRALEAITRGDTAAACRALQDLVNEVSALAGKKLTQQQADALLGEVSVIQTLLGC